MQDKIERASIPDYLLYGFAIASIGGPLALVTIYFFTSSYPVGTYSLYATLFGILLFLAPLLVWYKYSKKIVSSGGLYTFVEKAVGAKTAKLQGWIWLISYFLYLPYTVTYITYSLLPFLFRNLTPYLPLIQIALPMIIIVSLILSFRKVLYFIFVTAIMQLIIISIIAYKMLSVSLLHSFASVSGTGIAAFSHGVLVTSLLFVCASLPLFLGDEAKGGGKSIRKVLVFSFFIVAIFFILGSIALVSATQQQAASGLPGFLVLGSAIGKNFAYFVAIFSIISIFDLIIIEFIAIQRLSFSMLNLKPDRSLTIVGVLFILFSALGILNPEAFYQDTLILSLMSLYVSQVIVFLAYPFFARKRFKLQFIDIIIAMVSSLMMLYGLYVVVAPFLIPP